MHKQFELLKTILTSVDLHLTDTMIDQCLHYLDLLNQWNTKQNLTRITHSETQLYGHLVDSLLAIPHFNETHILDVGSGAGLPGIPLAIAKPDCHFTLLDSQQKRIAFLKQACYTLKLNNVTLIHKRIQEHQPDSKPDLITCRALTSIENIIEWTQHLKTPHNRIMAYKTTHDLVPTSIKHQIIPLPNIPNHLESRCLVIL